jgi:hydrogenase expression/formation protein HypC
MHQDKEGDGAERGGPVGRGFPEQVSAGEIFVSFIHEQIYSLHQSPCPGKRRRHISGTDADSSGKERCMCLSLPARVIAIDGEMAEVSVGGAIFMAGLQMVDDVAVGDYVLLHAGFAIEKLKEEDALETLRLLQEMDDAMRE